ncbi:MAG: isochorismatase family protein [Candidatus Hodarchaeota archaeon]
MWENTALIVVDVQYGLFIRPTPIYKENELLRNINYLVENAHSAHIPVFFIQHCSPRLVEDSVEWQLHPRLKVDDNDTFIVKKEPNAFKNTNLKKELDTRKIDHLVIVGIWTHNCVQATCRGAKKLGYEVILVRDGHSRDGPEKLAKKSIESWNRRLNEAGVTLKLTDEIDFRSRRDSLNNGK